MKSFVDGYAFDFPFSDNRRYVRDAQLSGYNWLKFWMKIFVHFTKAYFRLALTLVKGRCYFGSFKGEYGHMTAHTAPFLMYLHKKGVKITYCGMDLHKPLLIDEKGQSIISDFRPLRDFFSEVPPESNSTIPPKDVQEQIQKFESEAIQSKYPFWNIADDYYYWFIHRNFIIRGFTQVYNLEKYYRTKIENACCIFPRSKGAKTSHNNGEEWDYERVVSILKPFYNKIYIVGHPSQVLTLKASEQVELCITNDNAKIFEKIANSNLIITQHSGVNNLGEYFNKKVLIIYKGGKKVEDIGSMNNTLRFRKSLGNKVPLSFAFSEDEIVAFVKMHLKQKI